MSDSDRPPLPERLTDLLQAGAHEQTVACLNLLGSADAEARKRSLRAVRNEVEVCQSVFDGLATPLASFLTDDERAVRLTTAKLFVTLARADPTVVLPVADALGERLGDDEEFYYVRGRAAEALGVVEESDVTGVSLDVDSTDMDEGTPAFLSDRLGYLRGQGDDGQSDPPAGVGTIESVRDGTESVVEEMTSPDGGECPHCGLALAENEPSMCPRCGAPY